MKGNVNKIILMSMFHLALILPLTLGAVIVENNGVKHHHHHQTLPTSVDHMNHQLHSSHEDGDVEIMRGNSLAGGAPLLSSHPTMIVRHIRSVDHLQQQQQQLDGNDIMEQQQQQGAQPQQPGQDDNNNSIQSNSESEDEDQPVLLHKVQKSFVSSDMFPQENIFRMQTTPKGRRASQQQAKWLFRSTGSGSGMMGQQFPPRGLRRDSHFIRFGRNSNLDFDGFNLASALTTTTTNNNGNKKNNFIRLGRENPRRNNFIRLGRSGLWGNNERFGSKIGYFPDYYSQLFGGNPNIWEFAQQQPVPFAPSNFGLQG